MSFPRATSKTSVLCKGVEYDYVIVNQEIDDSVAQVKAILKAERLKRWRQIGLHDFVWLMKNRN